MSKAIAEHLMNPEVGEVQLYEPGEIPPIWQEALKRYGIKILQLAMTLGYIIPEYTMKDYILHAVESPSGYETLDIWGRQGSRKSNRTLQISEWVYQDWDTVLEEMVLVPDAHDLIGYEERGFLQKMKSVQKGEAIPLLAWDDLTVSLPSSTFKTDIDIYAAVDSAWAAIRTKIKVMVLNNPLIDRITKNVKDNVTLEVMISPNQVEQIERWFHLIGLKQMNSNFFKVQVEPLHKFDWRNVPTDVFREYQDLRNAIADLAVSRMGKAFRDEATLKEDMITPLQIMQEMSIAPSTLNEMIKTNMLPHEKINHQIFIDRKDFEDFKKCYLNNPRRIKDKLNQKT